MAGALLNPGDIVKGTLRVVRLLGESPGGVVYEVEGTTTARRRALRVMPVKMAADAEELKRLDREVTLVAKLADARFVRTFGNGQLEDGSPWVLMELLASDALSFLLQGEPKWTPQRACTLVRELALVLHRAHDSGVVHGDLCPRRVFLEQKDGQQVVKLLGCGLSHPRLVQTGGVSPYSAPEQMGVTGDLDPRVDVYALGVMLFELLTGAPPFSGPELQAQKAGPVPRADERAPECPRALADLVHKATSARASDRPATTKALAEALAPFAAGTPVVAVPVAAPPKPQGSRLWVAVAVAVVVVAGVAFAALHG
jgi:serine/threonine-protein kinase